ncbi:MAG: hypothetical protein UIB63_05740 [Methanobrevibacter sp.]|uniref:hypothetical protein n=1 Tax=Methanobrevibacter sp. TaxID=66852 RepID=UPI002E77EBBC|nr:hypothetical protein [Methanobrevibacter sp.]MEE0942596.1 hypothetical protein [Methanobrevibacter sp.]
MKFKKIMFVTLLLLAVLTLGAVSASQDMGASALENSNDEVIVGESQTDALVDDGSSELSQDNVHIIGAEREYDTDTSNQEDNFGVEVPDNANGTVIVSSKEQESLNEDLNDINEENTLENENTKVFGETLAFSGYDNFNQSEKSAVGLEVYGSDNILGKSIDNDINLGVGKNGFTFLELWNLIEKNLPAIKTNIINPLLKNELALYLNGIKAATIKLISGEFKLADFNQNFLDILGGLTSGKFVVTIKLNDGVVIYNASFSTLTNGTVIDATMPSTALTSQDVYITLSTNKPKDKVYTVHAGLIALIDPHLESGRPISDFAIDLWGSDMKDFWEKGGGKVNLGRFSEGSHKIIVLYAIDFEDRKNEYDYLSKVFTITVKKDTPKIIASAVTAAYKSGKKLVITLKDRQGVVSGKKVTVKVGSISKTLKTNSKGKISIDISTLAPKSYKATINSAADGVYKAASKSNVNVVVKKAKTKITAKTVKAKVNAKVKNVVAVVKFNSKKLLKGKLVTLKIKGKTYKVKTNKKGKAVFKVKNLNKKGAFVGTIKFAGDKYFKGTSKKVNVVVN